MPQSQRKRDRYFEDLIKSRDWARNLVLEKKENSIFS